MSEEKEEKTVLNAEEQVSGDALVDKTEVETTNDNDAEPAEFDAAAFAGTAKVEETNEGEEQEEGKTNETDTSADSDNSSDNSDDDDDFVWPDLSDSISDTEPEKKSEEDNGEIKPEGEEVSKPTEGEALDLTDDHYKQFAKNLGLEADSLDEIKNSIDDIIKENNELKEEAKYSGNTNKKIENLENFLKLDDESLMRKSLEADGLKGDKLENVLDKYTDTGLLEVEALKVRNNIDKAVQSERQAITKSDEADVARQQESRTESVQSFTDYMQSQESLFGFKLTGDSEKLPSVRENHVKYVTSGDYLSEITANEQNLAESSWLWRNRSVLQKAMSNNGRQNGRAEILNKIGNPAKASSSTFTEPGNTKEFDPRKFMNG